MMEYQIRTLKLDDALFVCLPDEVVELFGENAVIAIGKNRTLRLYHTKYWEALPDRLKTMPPALAKMLRAFISNSSLAAIGDDGEIEIPAKLCDYASLDESVKVKLIVDQTQNIADLMRWNESALFAVGSVGECLQIDGFDINKRFVFAKNCSNELYIYDTVEDLNHGPIKSVGYFHHNGVWFIDAVLPRTMLGGRPDGFVIIAQDENDDFTLLNPTTNAYNFVDEDIQLLKKILEKNHAMDIQEYKKRQTIVWANSVITGTVSDDTVLRYSEKVGMFITKDIATQIEREKWYLPMMPKDVVASFMEKCGLCHQIQGPICPQKGARVMRKEKIKTFTELLEYMKQREFVLVPSSVTWFDGEKCESDNVDLIDSKIVLSGKELDIDVISVGVFENGILTFRAESRSGIEYLMMCDYYH